MPVFSPIQLEYSTLGSAHSTLNQSDEESIRRDFTVARLLYYRHLIECDHSHHQVA